MKIVVTGGPVHAHLDPVKIITNGFKGRMMLEIAEDLTKKNIEVVFICAKHVAPKDIGTYVGQVVVHNGFEDYRDKVMKYAQDADAVVLGAAVANLIPLKPWKEKFPSHQYKPGDIIPIDFTIAPRVIDQVKRAMKKSAHLFGFKLLAGHPHDELIRAAYEVLLESKATCVFANDATDKSSLLTKYAVMKDRSIHEMKLPYVADFILRLMEDEYYETRVVAEIAPMDCFRAQDEAWKQAEGLIEAHKDEFVEVEGGMKFGTVAVRIKDPFIGSGTNMFMTTSRGKNELDGMPVKVLSVDHERLQIQATSKATLNAPLLHWIFSQYPHVYSIVHLHRQENGLPTYPYAPPGTKRDSIRGLPCRSFNIKGHGCFLLGSENGEVIK